MSYSGGIEQEVDNLAGRSASCNSMSLMLSVKQWEKKERPYAGKTRQKERENIIINFLFLNDWTTRQHPSIEKEQEEKEKKRKIHEGSEVVSIRRIIRLYNLVYREQQQTIVSFFLSTWQIGKVSSYFICFW